MTESIINHDTPAVLDMFGIYFNEGGDIDELAGELASYFSKLIMIKNGVKDTALLEVDSMELEKTASLITDTDTSDLLRMIQIMADFIAAKKSGVDPVVAIEVALTRLAGLDKTVDIAKLLSGISITGNPVKSFLNRKQTGGQNTRNTSSANNALGFSNSNNPISAPPEKPAAVSPSGPHELEEIDKWWSNFLGFTKAKSMMVWSHLQQIVVDGVEGKIIKLGYPQHLEHIKKMLQKDKKLINDLLSEFCGNEVAVSFVKVTVDNNKNNGQVMSQDNAKEFLEQHPKIKKLQDLIDGEVIDFRRSQ